MPQIFIYIVLIAQYNFYNLILALAVPVGIHGLWNYSLSSEVVSEQIAYITAFVIFEIPLSELTKDFHDDSTLLPNGFIVPSPVTTTLLK